MLEDPMRCEAKTAGLNGCILLTRAVRIARSNTARSRIALTVAGDVPLAYTMFVASAHMSR